MGNRTPLYQEHLAAGGKIVDFAGWEMPIHYGSQLNEHHQVRRAAGMFDVSHMTVIDLSGSQVKAFLQHLLANNVDRLKESGKALYSCMLQPDGGIIDDLIVYYLNPDWYRMVVNAGTSEKDLAWINKQAASFDVRIKERADLAMIAVQGPEAFDCLCKVLPDCETVRALKPFFATELEDLFIARTGYTGEDGVEVIIPNERAADFWRELREAGVEPIGLGARDTLRLEAGMNLYGTDMDESVTPLESGLGWTVAWEPQDRDFIGRKTLEQQRKNGVKHKLVGLVLKDRGVLRGHQKVLVGDAGEGEITSGTFSPTLGHAVAFARIPTCEQDHAEVEIRKKHVAVEIVKPPFVRNGKSCL